MGKKSDTLRKADLNPKKKRAKKQPDQELYPTQKEPWFKTKQEIVGPYR